MIDTLEDQLIKVNWANGICAYETVLEFEVIGREADFDYISKMYAKFDKCFESWKGEMLNAKI